MWPLLRSWLLRRGLGLLGWLVAAAAVLAILLGARRAGRNAERLEQLMRNVEVRYRQLLATTCRPRSRYGLARRLHDGTF